MLTGDKPKSVDPNRLSGLTQACYILKCVDQGQNEAQITTSLGGDLQLVKMWLSFLLHNNWMQKNESDELKITDKGIAMLETNMKKSTLAE